MAGSMEWGRLRRILERHGVRVESRGSEAKLILARLGEPTIIYVLQHKCCNSPNAVVWAVHVNGIKRRFGLSNEDLR